MSEARGLLYLMWLTSWRHALARKSIIAAILIGLFVLAVYAWSTRRVPDIMSDNDRGRHSQVDDEEGERESRKERERERRKSPEERVLQEFSNDVIMLIFVTMLAPLLSLIYATAAIGDEREDRTLVYLLTRPLGRWRLYLAKGLGILPVILLAVLGAFVVICLVAGEPGLKVLFRFLPGLALGTAAYTALFLLFGAVTPKPLIMSVVYAFLVETLVGNMPGTLKRMAISYHTRCLLYNAGADIGLAPPNPRHFVPISSESATVVLLLATAGLLVWGAIAFQRREYRDLA